MFRCFFIEGVSALSTLPVLMGTTVEAAAAPASPVSAAASAPTGEFVVGARVRVRNGVTPSTGFIQRICSFFIWSAHVFCLLARLGQCECWWYWYCDCPARRKSLHCQLRAVLAPTALPANTPLSPPWCFVDTDISSISHVHLQSIKISFCATWLCVCLKISL